MLNRDNERDGWKINASAGILRVASRFVASGCISACVRSVAALASALPILGALSVTPPAHAQCQGPGWLPGEGVPGVAGSVSAVLELPNGDLIVGGLFTLAGTTPVRNLARWDGSSWHDIGGGVNGTVLSIVRLASGDLIIAGAFSEAGSVAASRIARWNGVEWSALGAGVGGTIWSLVAQSNGDLLVAGEFVTAGGAPARRVARWDGAAWSPIGVGLGTANVVAGEAVNRLARLPSGELIAGGNFDLPGGSDLARWDGTNWVPFGSGSDGQISSVVPMSDGRVFIGGRFNSISGVAASGIAMWTGTQWAALGAGLALSTVPVQRQVNEIVPMADGSLYAAGRFDRAGNVVAEGLARWDGESWSAADAQFKSRVNSLVRDAAGQLIAGFSGDEVGPALSRGITRRTAQGWTSLGSGNSGRITAMARLPNGDVIVGGAFQRLGGVELNNIARWDGVSWSPLGTGIDGSIHSIRLAPSGEIIAVGFREVAGGRQSIVMRWDGQQWSPIGSNDPNAPLSSQLYAAIIMPNNDLIVSGVNPSIIRRWNGAAWSRMESNLNADTSGNRGPFTLELTNSGELIAGGLLSSSTPRELTNLARWNGTRWVDVGGGASGGLVGRPMIWDLVSMPNGDLVVAGQFTQVGPFAFPGGLSVNFLARWNGTSWSALGSGLGGFGGLASTIVRRGSDQLIALGQFNTAGGESTQNIAMWNGSSWSPLGAGIVFDGALFGSAAEIADNGELLVGSSIALAGGRASSAFARYTFTGIPAVGRQPKAAAFGAGETVTLSATASPGYQNVSVQWKRNGAPIANGPEGASVGGGTVSGAADTLASPTDGTASTLTITNIQPSDVGDYTAVFTNACGSSETVVAKARCRADFDGSMFVDANDFALFIDHFVRGCTGAGQSNSGPDASCETSADVDGSGFIDVDDFVAFVNAFERGC